MPQKGKNQQDLKKQNRALILRLICTKKCLSRTDIAMNTGLTKMTVTNVINELIASGFVYEGTKAEKSSAGRKAKVLYPTSDKWYSLGIYLSRDYLVFSVLSLEASIIKKHILHFENKESKKSITEKLLLGTDLMLKEIEKEKLLGIGVAAIGALDIEKGVLLNPTDFFGVTNLEIKSILEKRTGLKVLVNNDMNAAAIAELLYGKNRTSDFIYLGVTHGIGVGIVINGSLYTGENGFSGEIGHMTINFNGETCSCGNKGCLETYASIPNITKKFKGQLTFEQIIEYSQKNISPYKELIDEVCFCLGVSLANCVNALDIKQIFLGHEAAKGKNQMAEKIEKILNDRILFKDNKQASVKVSSFFEEAPVIGSGVLVLNELFF